MNRATFDRAIAELRELAEDRAAHYHYLSDLLAWQEAGGGHLTWPAPEGRRGLSAKAAEALESDVVALYVMLREPGQSVAYDRDYPRLRAALAKQAAARREAARSPAGSLADLLRLDIP